VQFAVLNFFQHLAAEQRPWFHMTDYCVCAGVVVFTVFIPGHKLASKQPSTNFLPLIIWLLTKITHITSFIIHIIRDSYASLVFGKHYHNFESMCLETEVVSCIAKTCMRISPKNQKLKKCSRFLPLLSRSRNNVQGIATVYWLESPDIGSRWSDNFCTLPEEGWVPPSLQCNDYRMLFW
jgi:hypothetical protein